MECKCGGKLVYDYMPYDCDWFECNKCEKNYHIKDVMDIANKYKAVVEEIKGIYNKTDDIQAIGASNVKLKFYDEYIQARDKIKEAISKLEKED